ncbi:MAG: protease SohB [Acidiferrobacterales bacterium]|nr:protease SohB [Acidiferrobacterales bacterium]
MEQLAEYALFLAKTVTIIVAFLVPVMMIAAIAARQRQHQKEHLEVNNINRRYEAMSNAIDAVQLPKKHYKEKMKKQKKEQKSSSKKNAEDSEDRKRIFVFNFEGDLEATEIDRLREEITSVLTIADAPDEVVVKLESRGGVVHGYGLAASQLKRIKDQEIQLTVSVDKVAASGGYLMACVADKIIAAPFAVVGSVGVLAQIPNFHRALEKHNIDYQEYTAGEYKRTVGMFSEPTEKGKAKFMEELEDVHSLFKEFVQLNRPEVDVDQISTGEHWYGTRALDLKLVDELRTSDDYLLEASKTADIYEVIFVRKESLSDRFKPAFAGLLGSVVSDFIRKNFFPTRGRL